MTKRNQTANYALPLYRIALGALFGVMLLTLPLVVETRQELYLGLAALGALAIVGAPAFLWKDFDIFEPLSFVALMTAGGVSFKIFYILACDDRPYVIRRLLLGKPPETLLRGSLVMVAGLLCFVAGYWRRYGRLPLDQLFLPRFHCWDPTRLRQVSIVLLAVAGAAFLVFAIRSGASLSSLESLSEKRFIDPGDTMRDFRDERFQSGSYYLYRLAGLAKFVSYLMLAWMVRQRRPWCSLDGLLLGSSAALMIVLCLFMQSRASIVLLMLDWLILSYYLTRRLPMKTVIALGAVAACLMLLQLSLRVRSEHSPLDLVEKTIAGRDLMDISKTAHIINAVPEQLEYRYGETLIGWMAVPVPASLWPDKPLWAEKGVVICREVFGATDNVTGTTIGLMAELYWNFGWAGVCVGAWLLGSLFRHIYATFRTHQGNPAVVLLYTVLVGRLTIFTFGGDLGTGLLKTALDMIPLAAILLPISLTERRILSPSRLPGTSALAPLVNLPRESQAMI